MMFDDDDDGVEPQCKAVDEYYFEVTKDELVCFSILPFQFDENDKVENCDSEKKVYLRGVIDKSLYLVHKQVVAWRVGLDCEQPNISVLSSEGSWIKLLSPWKCYKDEISRSILITVQMLHFVRRHHRDKRRLQGRLWDHLTKVFNKLDTKPAMEDLRKHHSLIKLFLERDPALMNLKILHRFIGDITKTSVEPRASGTKVQFTGSDEPCPRNSDTDSDYDDDEDSDSYDNNDDYNSDAYTKNDVDTDLLCALCDDGGNLLSCIGQCKRSFHPRKKDGRESKCKTLGYTSAQLKEIDSYLCKNCECDQHQCFKCRELEPSSEPNAKVFKCNNPTCGHFYHPKCVATLLEPEDADGSCELAKKIMAGMSFTCPVHWCFECGRMEDRAQRAMQFAVCRRCPKSYHRECLPREISFETKDKNIKQRAWKLSGIVIIYCLDHKICRHTGNAERGHIKFPNTPKITEVRDLAKRKGKMVGKQKRSADQCSKKSTKVLNRLPAETIEHTQNSLEHMVLEPECSARNLKEDLQIEPYIVGPACRSGQKALKGQNRKFGSSLSSVMGIKTPASVVGSKTKNRTTSGPKKERSSRTSCNITKTCVDHSAQIADKLHAHMQPINTQDNLINNPPVDNNTELDNQICRIPEDKDGNGKEKLSEHSGEPEEDATNKDTSHEDKLNAVLGKTFVVIHAGVDQSKFKSSAERGTELGENADGHDSISREISMGENHMCRGMCEQETRSGKGKIARSESAKSGSGNSVVTPDHVDDNPPEKLLHIARVDKMAITDKLHTQPEYDCDKDREVNGVSAFQEEPNSSWCNVNPELMGTHNSEEKSRKRRKLKKKAADGNNIDLDKNSRCNPTEDGKKAHCDESSYRCPSNHKELDYQDRKFGNSEPSGSHMQPGDMDNLMDNPDNNAELDNKICKVPEFKGAKGKEKSSEHPGEPEEDTTNKDISHEDERNAVVGKIFVDIHAEVDQSKFKSSAERSMGLGENADGHDSISGQVISMGENQLCQSMCEKESRSGKGKIARKESPKSGSDNDVVTPDHSHCNPPKRLLSAPHVDKMAITDRLHTQSEYCCDKDREVNWGHDFQEEPNGSQCNVNRKVMGIHTSDDKSRKRRKHKKKAADGNNTDSDKTRRCINIKDGKEALCDAISHQCSPNHEELDYQDRKFGNNGCSGSCYNDENGTAEVSESRSRQSTEPSRREILTLSTRENSSISPINRNSQEKPRNHSPNRQRTYEQLPAANEIQDRKFGNSATNGSRCNDENSAAEISEYKSRLSTGPSRREIFTLNTRGSSYNSPMGRNSQKKPRNYSPNRQRTYRYMCEQHIATNEYRYEQWHNVSYPSNCHGPRSHVPLQPVFAPTDFDAHQWHGHHSYPRGLEHGITEWRSPCFYPGSQGYFTGGWQSTYCPGRPENLDYSRNANDLPIRGYDERDNFMHGGYRTMGFDPAAMYFPHQNSNNSAYQPRTDVNMEGCGTAYGGQLREYGATSNYTLGFEPWRPAAGSVMDRYAPHLEQTNDRRRG